ncbi:type I methionyl aminopeptidase [Desulforhabdus amnigena]|uniref:Methionine aminopeptidase n=1 Tax=Desulforhabdus amnigena TaxID=40218 RepID=A0A9W6LAG4_9BACT|nr:type I methionyl aminopeptidase [Desulforhabdus amnigena]NLJ29137.1 type I methionyl aminopeptidase [Deltaproteobacteria bacterium]GLI36060.1 methionine aminopeptidase [Desulforhabdus amnigena]
MITLRSQREIEKIRKACCIVAEVLQHIKEHIQPGVTTLELNVLSEELAKKRKAKPAFKGYQGYPYSLCTSINEEVVHGMPSKHRHLHEGDIISIDFGVVIDGYYGDSAITVAVGKISEDAEQLCKVTEQSLYEGIRQVVVGNHLSDISHAIQSYVESRGYSVVREFVGHGIGQHLHESPQIPNYGPPGRGVKLRAGMVFAIEPMINLGGPEVEILKDQWTAVTVDRKISAHFEHTVAVTDNGPDILTRL